MPDGIAGVPANSRTNGKKAEPSLGEITAAAERICDQFAVVSLKDTEADLIRRVSNGKSLTEAEAEVREILADSMEYAADEPTLAPTPIPDLSPAPSLDMGLFPAPLREWVIDEAERMSCPVEFVAISALAGLAIVIGTQVGVKPKARDDFFVYSNLYALIVADSGSKKTDAMDKGLRFVHEIEKEKREEFDSREAENEAAAIERRIEIDGIETQLKSLHSGKPRRSDETTVDKGVLMARLQELKAVKPPAPERLLGMDLTIEKAGILLNDNPRGLGIVQDEISPLLDSFKNKEKERDRGFYLKAANGTGSEIIDRVSRESLLIKNLCITLIGGVQPARIASLVETAVANHGDDGLLARFGVTVYPDPVPEYRYIDTEPKGLDDARAIFRRLYNLDCSRFKQLTREDGGRRYLNFADDAQVYFAHWLTHLENEKRQVGTNGTEIPVSHISKYAGLMPKLALIFQLVDIVSGIDPEATSISLKNARNAAEWTLFFKAHAKRLYSNSTKPEFKAAKAVLQRLRNGELSHVFTARELYRKHWRGLSTTKETAAAIEVLVDYGWIKPMSFDTAGKPVTKYVLTNSEALEKGAISANRSRMDPDEIAEAEAIRAEACGAL